VLHIELEYVNNNMKQLEDTDIMPFGKHKGLQMQEVPASYLHWLWTNGLSKEVKTKNVADYISRRLDALKVEYTDGIWDI